MNLPSNPEYEAAIIACCLLGGLDATSVAVESVPPESFMRDDARAAFRILEGMVTTGSDINAITFTQKWSEGGKRVDINPDLVNLDSVPSAWNLPYYAGPVIDCWRKRQIMERCSAAIEAGEAGKDADTLLEIVQAINVIPTRGVELVTGLQATERLIEDLELRSKLNGQLSGIETGFTRFDRMTDGLQKGELTVIAARPSIGKSAFGSGVAIRTALMNSIPTLVVTLEMSVEAWMRRMLSALSEIKMGEIRAGSYTRDNFTKFAAFNARCKKAPIYFINAVGGLTINRVAAAIQRYVRIYDIKLVIVDYLQKVKPSENHEKRTYEVAEVSSALKGLAEKTKTSFLVLAQLNREPDIAVKPRAPRLSDLADSSQIERDADTVGLLHRDRNDPTGKATLLIAKQRDGDTGSINLKFNGPLCRFENPMFQTL